MLNLCPPQQTGFTRTVNCSVAQNCCSEPTISCRISLEPKDTAYQNDSLTLQHGGFHVRHLYLSCHYVKQRQVSCGLTQGSERCSCETRLCSPHFLRSRMQNALLQPACLTIGTLQGVPCSSFLFPTRPWRWSRHLTLSVWEQREQRGWAESLWLTRCRLGALSQTSRDSMGTFTELEQEWNDLSNNIATV